MAEEIISESHSSREEEHVAPNVARFARKQGGWTAIAYILGNVQKYEMIP